MCVCCRGPNTLTISNSDQSVAVAVGDIKVGDYEFKLTVTDAEDQSASDKLKVTVKMSKYQLLFLLLLF